MNSNQQKGETILVVHRDPAVLVLMQKLLAVTGCRVLVAREAEEAVELIRQKHISIDIVLPDVRLRENPGAEFVNDIRTIRPGTPVMWIEGSIDGDFIRLKLAEGDGQYLPDAVRRAMTRKTMTAGSGGRGQTGAAF